MKAVKIKKSRKPVYELPPFNMEALMDHIASLVKNAPGGIVPLIVDLFCGAGGSSDGLMAALAKNGYKCYVTIAGVNHDLKAIFSHAKNHPLAYYSTEDFKSAKLDIIMQIIEECRKRFPQCPVIVWASFDCTNHSNAKGGMSRDADSRTLPWHIYRYLEVIQPLGLWVENVKEFSEWGPLQEKHVVIMGKKKITLPEPIPVEEQEQYFTDVMNAGHIAFCKLHITKEKRKPTGVAPDMVPIKPLKATFYRKWHKKVDKTAGFHHKAWLLNCADFGVPQNRKRWFMVFMKKGVRIAKPQQTHAKTPHGDLKPHVPVKTCINFDNEGESIFTPGKITSDESFKRVYKGLIKFVAGGKKEFMAQRNSGMAASKVFGTDEPARTVTTTGGNQEVVRAHFLTRYNGNTATDIKSGNDMCEPCPTLTTANRFAPTTVKFITRANGTTENTHNPGSSMDEASPTLTCLPTLGVANIQFITKKYSSNNNTSQNPGSSMDDPAPTVTTFTNGLGVACVNFLDVVYGNGTPSSMEWASPTLRTKDGLQYVNPIFLTNYQGQSSANSIDEPAPTVMTQEKLALTGVKYFICNQYSGGGQLGGVEEPAGALTTVPKSRLLTCQWISPTNFDNVGTSIDEPCPTVLASRQHHNFIYMRQWGGSLSSMDSPAPVVIASQHKEPMSMVTLDENDLYMAIPVFESDSDTVVLIKEFMALYGIADIMIRMLEVPELLAIQSFPKDYYLAPGTTDQKKFIGNAVPPLMARRIAEAQYECIVEYIVNELKIAA